MLAPDFEAFMEENKKFGKYKDSEKVKEMFELMSDPVNIFKMLTVNDRGRPALEGIIQEIEENQCADFDIENDHFLRQAVGTMVRFIIAPFGYEVDIQKNMYKWKYITSATHYKYNPSSARLKLRVVVETI